MYIRNGRSGQQSSARSCKDKQRCDEKGAQNLVQDNHETPGSCHLPAQIMHRRAPRSVCRATASCGRSCPGMRSLGYSFPAIQTALANPGLLQLLASFNAYNNFRYVMELLVYASTCAVVSRPSPCGTVSCSRLLAVHGARVTAEYRLHLVASHSSDVMRYLRPQRLHMCSPASFFEVREAKLGTLV